MMRLKVAARAKYPMSRTPHPTCTRLLPQSRRDLAQRIEHSPCPSAWCGVGHADAQSDRVCAEITHSACADHMSSRLCVHAPYTCDAMPLPRSSWCGRCLSRFMFADADGACTPRRLDLHCGNDIRHPSHPTGTLACEPATHSFLLHSAGDLHIRCQRSISPQWYICHNVRNVSTHTCSL